MQTRCTDHIDQRIEAKQCDLLASRSIGVRGTPQALVSAPADRVEWGQEFLAQHFAGVHGLRFFFVILRLIKAKIMQ
jgi:hypothetical protein